MDLAASAGSKRTRPWDTEAAETRTTTHTHTHTHADAQAQNGEDVDPASSAPPITTTKKAVPPGTEREAIHVWRDSRELLCDRDAVDALCATFDDKFAVALGEHQTESADEADDVAPRKKGRGRPRVDVVQKALPWGRVPLHHAIAVRDFLSLARQTPHNPLYFNSTMHMFYTRDHDVALVLRDIADLCAARLWPRGSARGLFDFYTDSSAAREFGFESELDADPHKRLLRLLRGTSGCGAGGGLYLGHIASLLKLFAPVYARFRMRDPHDSLSNAQEADIAARMKEFVLRHCGDTHDSTVATIFLAFSARLRCEHSTRAYIAAAHRAAPQWLKIADAICPPAPLEIPTSTGFAMRTPAKRARGRGAASARGSTRGRQRGRGAAATASTPANAGASDYESASGADAAEVEVDDITPESIQVEAHNLLPPLLDSDYLLPLDDLCTALTVAFRGHQALADALSLTYLHAGAIAAGAFVHNTGLGGAPIELMRPPAQIEDSDAFLDDRTTMFKVRAEALVESVRLGIHKVADGEGHAVADMLSTDLPADPAVLSPPRVAVEAQGIRSTLLRWLRTCAPDAHDVIVQQHLSVLCGVEFPVSSVVRAAHDGDLAPLGQLALAALARFAQVHAAGALSATAPTYCWSAPLPSITPPGIAADTPAKSVLDGVNLADVRPASDPGHIDRNKWRSLSISYSAWLLQMLQLIGSTFTAASQHRAGHARGTTQSGGIARAASTTRTPPRAVQHTAAENVHLGRRRCFDVSALLDAIVGFVRPGLVWDSAVLDHLNGLDAAALALVETLRRPASVRINLPFTSATPAPAPRTTRRSLSTSPSMPEGSSDGPDLTWLSPSSCAEFAFVDALPLLSAFARHAASEMRGAEVWAEVLPSVQDAARQAAGSPQTTAYLLGPLDVCLHHPVLLELFTAIFGAAQSYTAADTVYVSASGVVHGSRIAATQYEGRAASTVASAVAAADPVLWHPVQDVASIASVSSLFPSLSSTSIVPTASFGRLYHASSGIQQRAVAAAASANQSNIITSGLRLTAGLVRPAQLRLASACVGGPAPQLSVSPGTVVQARCRLTPADMASTEAPLTRRADPGLMLSLTARPSPKRSDQSRPPTHGQTSMPAPDVQSSSRAVPEAAPPALTGRPPRAPDGPPAPPAAAAKPVSAPPPPGPLAPPTFVLPATTSTPAAAITPAATTANPPTSNTVQAAALRVAAAGPPPFPTRKASTSGAQTAGRGDSGSKASRNREKCITAQCRQCTFEFTLPDANAVEYVSCPMCDAMIGARCRQPLCPVGVHDATLDGVCPLEQVAATYQQEEKLSTGAAWAAAHRDYSLQRQTDRGAVAPSGQRREPDAAHSLPPAMSQMSEVSLELSAEEQEAMVRALDEIESSLQSPAMPQKPTASASLSSSSSATGGMPRRQDTMLAASRGDGARAAEQARALVASSNVDPAAILSQSSGSLSQHTSSLSQSTPNDAGPHSSTKKNLVTMYGKELFPDDLQQRKPTASPPAVGETIFTARVRAVSPYGATPRAPTSAGKAAPPSKMPSPSAAFAQPVVVRPLPWYEAIMREVQRTFRWDETASF